MELAPGGAGDFSKSSVSAWWGQRPGCSGLKTNRVRKRPCEEVSLPVGPAAVDQEPFALRRLPLFGT